jgi:hypothetical protein
MSDHQRLGDDAAAGRGPSRPSRRGTRTGSGSPAGGSGTPRLHDRVPLHFKASRRPSARTIASTFRSPTPSIGSFVSSDALDRIPVRVEVEPLQRLEIRGAASIPPTAPTAGPYGLRAHEHCVREPSRHGCRELHRHAVARTADLIAQLRSVLAAQGSPRVGGMRERGSLTSRVNGPRRAADALSAVCDDSHDRLA